MNKESKLSVVIPAYNEGNTIENTIKKVCSYLNEMQLNYELIIVNDGSSDNTEQLITSLMVEFSNLSLVSYPSNKGKGHAVRKGMLKSVGHYIVFMDADLSTPLSQFNKLSESIKRGSEIIIGDRKSKEAMIHRKQPLTRIVLGRGFVILSNLILGIKINDFTCGFKCFSNEATQRIFSRTKIDNWSFDAEILFIAKKLNYAIDQIPVDWENMPETKVKVFRDIITSFLGLIEIYRNNLTGLYD